MQAESCLAFKSTGVDILLYPLAAGLIRRIESICASFLWKGNLPGAKGARVSWFNCFPKAEGGLGPRNVKVWNKTCFCRTFGICFSSRLPLDCLGECILCEGQLIVLTSDKLCS